MVTPLQPQTVVASGASVPQRYTVSIPADDTGLFVYLCARVNSVLSLSERLGVDSLFKCCAFVQVSGWKPVQHCSEGTVWLQIPAAGVSAFLTASFELACTLKQ